MAQESIKLHFRVDSNGFLDIVRQVYWYESKTRATQLMDSIPDISKADWIRLLSGDYQLIGLSVCEDWKNCYQCKDTKTTLQILKKPDKKWRRHLRKEGLIGRIHDTVKIICIMTSGEKKLVLVPLELMLNYAHTIDRVETQLTIRKYHGGLSKDFVERVDHSKLDAHERLFEGMKLRHNKCHLEDKEYVECYVQEAVEKFYQEVITEHNQPRKITVTYDDSFTDKRNRFNAEVTEYSEEYDDQDSSSQNFSKERIN